jgi:hypothetical protein
MPIQPIIKVCTAPGCEKLKEIEDSYPLCNEHMLERVMTRRAQRVAQAGIVITGHTPAPILITRRLPYAPALIPGSPTLEALGLERTDAPTDFVTTDDVYARYVALAQARGLEPVTKKRLSRTLALQLGHHTVPRRINGGLQRVWPLTRLA